MSPRQWAALTRSVRGAREGVIEVSPGRYRGSVGILARDMPFFAWVIHVFTPLHYKAGFENQWRREIEKIRAEMLQSEQESGKVIDAIERELGSMQ